MPGISKPLVASLLVVVALIAGGTAVFVAGRAVDEADRRALIAWQAEALPLVEAARAHHAALADQADGIDADTAALAGELRELRDELLAVPRSEILEDTAAAYAGALEEMLRALDALPAGGDAGARAAFDARWEAARDRLADGDARLVRLRCRARLERCATLPTV